jgi:hypothetical protein
MSSKPDDAVKCWHAYAIQQANLARRTPQIERTVAETKVPEYCGVIDLAEMRRLEGLGIRVFFGNDGFLQDHRVRREVAVLRKLLTARNIEILGFGTDTRKKKPGSAWALVVGSDEPLAHLANFLYAAHAVAFFSNDDKLKDLYQQFLSEAGFYPWEWEEILAA